MELLKRPEIAYGFLLGSLYLLTYAMARGIDSGDSAVAFTTISAALVIVIYLGHRSFNGQFPARRAEVQTDTVPSQGPGCDQDDPTRHASGRI